MSKLIFGMIALFSVEAVSAQANSRSDVKRRGRSQNGRLLKGLPA